MYHSYENAIMYMHINVNMLARMMMRDFPWDYVTMVMLCSRNLEQTVTFLGWIKTGIKRACDQSTAMRLKHLPHNKYNFCQEIMTWSNGKQLDHYRLRNA